MLNRGILQQIRSGQYPTPNYRHILSALRDDYDRWEFCLAMAEHYRAKWNEQAELQGQRIVMSSQRRYRNMSNADCRTAGILMWSKSITARDWDDMEQRFRRWSTAYASAIGVLRGGSGNVPQPRVSESPSRMR